MSGVHSRHTVAARPGLAKISRPTARTPETVRPSQSAQVRSACFLGGKQRLKLRQVPRILLHPPTLHIGGYLSQAHTHLALFNAKGVTTISVWTAPTKP